MSTTAVQQHSTKRPAAPAQSNAARRDIRGLLEGPLFREQLAKVLPRHLTPDRMVRVAITATMKVPKLLECTPESLTGCLLTCSQFGLEPDGRRAHLIPFEDKRAGQFICTLIIDYKGLVELAMRSGLVSHIHADVVREGDVFEYSCGEITRHVPWFLRRDADKPAEAGQDIAVYALARMKDGASAMVVLSIEEVYAIRDNSQGWQSFQKGYAKKSPWDPSDWVSEQEMKKKTAIRRLSKLLPLSPEFRDAVEADDDGDSKMRNVTPEPATSQFLPVPAEQPRAVDPDPEAGSNPEPEPEPTEPTQPAPKFVRPAQSPDPAPAATPQAELGEVVTRAGYNFDQFASWAREAGFFDGKVEPTSFDEVESATASRLLKTQRGMLAKLAELAGGAR